MSKSSCHSRLSSTATTPDLDMPNPIENHSEVRRPSLNNERRTTNVNYVRHVLRKFFGGYNKKYFSNTVFDDISGETTIEHLQSPVFINPCLQFEKHTKFSGRVFFRFVLQFWKWTERFQLFFFDFQAKYCLIGFWFISKIEQIICLSYGKWLLSVARVWYHWAFSEWKVNKPTNSFK